MAPTKLEIYRYIRIHTYVYGIHVLLAYQTLTIAPVAPASDLGLGSHHLGRVRPATDGGGGCKRPAS